MIGSLRGKLISKKHGNVLLEVNGVGYNVHLSVHNLSILPGEGSDLFLYIYTHVREDTIGLYGFPDEEERNIFTTLIGISGIGPKLALNILSGIPAEKFIEAVESEDTALLSRIPGVGKKTANRLILELREKLPAATFKKDMIYDDVLSALLNLGYKKSAATEALDRVYNGNESNIETLIRETLKYLTNE
ncbi:Holliday junction ATP-dependent DNA helicase RuvA [bacterium BMS3Abin07]|nr:Holliday junction ATP-dependent DNA helicase RuvA [bacterium BMS3Abin07]GBE31510.1 Holliday junction ATP-dependent DNA helicase RuvA [bacterium BMS3Bbin05]HDL19901.1 Holliday junction branch migration protein RuvA [Nitrospirota bacterium]HDO22585.1 Holliday junction branch migration protein RuvA [Nitrospirota bacterium]HDZ87089.1 Holliday junction branch migration protein RuvA [Nitrospirota bacterium]